MLARHHFLCPDLTDKRRITDFWLPSSANQRPALVLLIISSVHLPDQSRLTKRAKEGNPTLETVEAKHNVVVPSLPPLEVYRQCTGRVYSPVPGRPTQLYRARLPGRVSHWHLTTTVWTVVVWNHLNQWHQSQDWDQPSHNLFQKISLCGRWRWVLFGQYCLPWLSK